MSDESDYEYDYQEEEDDDHEMETLEDTSANDLSMSVSHENSLNNLINKYRKLASDKSVSVSLEDIAEVVAEYAKEMSEIFDIETDAALVLLMHNQWNKEMLQEKFFNDAEKVLTVAGVILGNPTNTSLPFFCKVCDSEINIPDEAVILNCNHKSCRECFSQYLFHQVRDGSGCTKAKCMEYKCNSTIFMHIFKKYLEPTDFNRYHRFMLEDFIKSCSRMRWCTSPKCGLVIVASSSQVKSVKCSCTQCTCFQCGEEAHEPASCEQTKLWLEKCSEDFPTKKWILLNTKNCPACKEAIEKNQGCNHMTCKACKFQFCWICLGLWSEHNDNYRCNKPAEKIEGRTAEKLELERYVHFFERYHGHGKGMDYAAEQIQSMRARLEFLDSSSKGELDFLQQALKVLETVVDCRRVLKYTYVMGCFLDPVDPKKNLFEYQQEMLEKNTEMLSQFTEMKTFLENTGAINQIVNLKGVTENFKTSLLNSMEDGKLTDNQI